MFINNLGLLAIWFEDLGLDFNIEYSLNGITVYKRPDVEIWIWLYGSMMRIRVQDQWRHHPWIDIDLHDPESLNRLEDTFIALGVINEPCLYC